MITKFNWKLVPRPKPSKPPHTTPDKCLGHDFYFEFKRPAVDSALNRLGYRCRHCGEQIIVKDRRAPNKKQNK